MNPTSPATRAPLDPQNLEQLQSAFQAFNTATETFQNYYLQLEKRIEELNLELERKNRELKINLVERERMRNYLATLLESISAGVIVTDENREIVTINRAAREIFALPENLGETATLFELIPDFARSRPLQNALLRGAERRLRFELELEKSAQTLDVQILPAAICELETRAESNFDPALEGGAAENCCQPSTVNCQLSTDAQRELIDSDQPFSTIHHPLTKGVILVIHDVTELKELARQNSLNSRLKAMGEIAMNVAHEVRNPLGSIELFAATLHRELEGRKDLQQLAAYLQTGVRTIDAIVNNILLFARNSESGARQEICAQKVRPAELLEEVLLFLKPALDEKSIRVTRRFRGEGRVANTGEGEVPCLRQAPRGRQAAAPQQVDEASLPPVELPQVDEASLPRPEGASAPELSFRRSEAPAEPPESHTITTSGISPENRFTADHSEILVDPELLRQVLMNLIRNAIQAMSKNGHLELEIQRENGSIFYRIFDDGCGIPSKIQHNIFKPFCTSRQKGTGLGLAISQRIIQAHRGEITFSSRISGGTVFTVKLPANS